MKYGFIECAGTIIKDPKNGELICPKLTSYKARPNQVICDLKCKPGYKASLKKVVCQSIGWRPPIEVACTGSGMTPGLFVGFLMGGLIFLIVGGFLYAKYNEYEQDQKSKNPERKTLSEMFFGKIDRMVNGERAHPQVNNDETENNSQPQIHQTPKTPNTKIRGMTQG